MTPAILWKLGLLVVTRISAYSQSQNPYRGKHQPVLVEETPSGFKVPLLGERDLG